MPKKTPVRNYRALPGGQWQYEFTRFDTRIGPVPFTVIFVNPADSNDPLIFSGTGEPAGYRIYLPMVLK